MQQPPRQQSPYQQNSVIVNSSSIVHNCAVGVAASVRTDPEEGDSAHATNQSQQDVLLHLPENVLWNNIGHVLLHLVVPVFMAARAHGLGTTDSHLSSSLSLSSAASTLRPFQVSLQ